MICVLVSDKDVQEPHILELWRADETELLKGCFTCIEKEELVCSMVVKKLCLDAVILARDCAARSEH